PSSVSHHTTSTVASSGDTAVSTVVGCRSVMYSTWQPSAQADTIPLSRPSPTVLPTPTRNPRSSSSPSCEKYPLPPPLCSAIMPRGSRDPPEPTTQLLIRSPRRRERATLVELRGR